MLLRLGGWMAGGTALEIGCGQGAGIELILDRFGADRVVGVDLDEAMITRARRRLAGRNDEMELRVGDAAATDLPDASVDAVFDFGIVHHLPDWRAAIDEVARVLRAGGRLYYSEVTKHALDRPSYRLLFDHPDHDRFTADDFVAALEERSLRVGGRQHVRPGQLRPRCGRTDAGHAGRAQATRRPVRAQCGRTRPPRSMQTAACLAQSHLTHARTHSYPALRHRRRTHRNRPANREAQCSTASTAKSPDPSTRS